MSTQEYAAQLGNCCAALFSEVDTIIRYSSYLFFGKYSASTGCGKGDLIFHRQSKGGQMI
jgi:hypothetical protein